LFALPNMSVLDIANTYNKKKHHHYSPHSQTLTFSSCICQSRSIYTYPNASTYMGEWETNINIGLGQEETYVATLIKIKQNKQNNYCMFGKHKYIIHIQVKLTLHRFSFSRQSKHRFLLDELYLSTSNST